jgi:hypothetical protein
MTVTSLWTALDEASCGKAVGIDDFTLRTSDDSKPTVLAVDLSIWIVEALSSTALCSFNEDPAVYLVYQRSAKLLRLGLGLVFVLEGKRRVHSSDSNELRQRRSGSQFWSSTQRCASLLRLMGVPVVEAEAEGEALCALLNAMGICDGVISNDGDCLLFGAKVVYCKFTVENLENRQVIKYDASKLSVSVEKEYDSSGSNESMALSREDLISFALLTGSDMTGSGVPHVGYKKAINLLHALKKLKHRPDNRTCLDELLKWGDELSEQVSITNGEFCMQCDDDGPSTIKERCCSICLHPGDKLHHEKNGCIKCGTEAGEGCFVVTAKEKFVLSIKAKVMKMSAFANHDIVNEYFSPNGNHLPKGLPDLRGGFNASPKVTELLSTSLIVKGHTEATSKEYIGETLPPLLARLELWKDQRNKYAAIKQQQFKPFPLQIEKECVKDFTPCYEIKWSLDVGDEGKLEFTTLESQSLLQQSKHSSMCKAFHQEDRRKRQEQDRHKHFIGQKPNAHKRRLMYAKQRENNFSKSRKPSKGKRRERNFAGGSTTMSRQEPRSRLPTISEHNHDVQMLMQSIPGIAQADEESDEELDIQSEADPNDEFDRLEPFDENERNADSDKYNYVNSPIQESGLYNGFESSMGLIDTMHRTGNRWKSDHSDRNHHDFTKYVKSVNANSYLEATMDFHDRKTTYDESYDSGLQFDSRYFAEDYLCTSFNDPYHSHEALRNEIFSADAEAHRMVNYDMITTGYENNTAHGLSHHNSMPVLTPSKKLFVNLGIQVEVTPIVSRRWREE